MEKYFIYHPDDCLEECNNKDEAEKRIRILIDSTEPNEIRIIRGVELEITCGIQLKQNKVKKKC